MMKRAALWLLRLMVAIRDREYKAFPMYRYRGLVTTAMNARSLRMQTLTTVMSVMCASMGTTTTACFSANALEEATSIASGEQSP
jgi:hypothetical protein